MRTFYESPRATTTQERVQGQYVCVGTPLDHIPSRRPMRQWPCFDEFLSNFLLLEGRIASWDSKFERSWGRQILEFRPLNMSSESAFLRPTSSFPRVDHIIPVFLAYGGECGDGEEHQGWHQNTKSMKVLLIYCHPATCATREYCVGRNGTETLVFPISQLKRFIPSISGHTLSWHGPRYRGETHTHFKRHRKSSRVPHPSSWVPDWVVVICSCVKTSVVVKILCPSSINPSAIAQPPCRSYMEDGRSLIQR